MPQGWLRASTFILRSVSYLTKPSTIAIQHVSTLKQQPGEASLKVLPHLVEYYGLLSVDSSMFDSFIQGESLSSGISFQPSVAVLIWALDMPLITKSPCPPSHSGNYSPGITNFPRYSNPRRYSPPPFVNISKMRFSPNRIPSLMTELSLIPFCPIFPD